MGNQDSVGNRIANGAFAKPYQEGRKKTSKTDTSVADNVVSSILEAFLAAIKGVFVARWTQVVLLFKLRGLVNEELAKKVEREKRSLSNAPYQEIAIDVALTGVNYGRQIEAAARGYKRIQYSAIIDANVCGICKAADGREGETSDDLPPVPNVVCLGRWRCRCVHVYIFDEVS